MKAWHCPLLLLWSRLGLAGDLRIEAWTTNLNQERVKVGAEISIDGVPTGEVTPTVIRDLAPGTHQVELRSGCGLAVETVTITENSRAHIRVDLVSHPAKLYILLTPSDASLQLDGQDIQAVSGEPTTVSCGRHTLSASLEGYETTLTSLHLAPGEIQHLRMDLVALESSPLQVAVQPATALITVDGEVKGTGKVSFEVFRGPHVVEASLDGYLPRQETIFVTSSDPYELELVLEREPWAGNKQQRPLASPVFASRTKLWGAGLSVLGAGTLIYGGFHALRTMSAYQEYLSRADAVKAGVQDEAFAERFFEEEVQPLRTKMRVGLTLGATGFTGGLVLSFRY